MKKLTLPVKIDRNLLFPPDLNKNNFDFLRFFLATAVIYSHCFVICYAKIIDTEPISLFTQNQVDLGGVAVSFFFIISGFLIVKSFENSSTTAGYLLKRILRICPGFYIAFLVSVFVFGVLGTAHGPHKFEHLKIYLQSFSVKRTIIQFFTLEAPKGPKTFSTNPLPNMINESFWTIQYEFTCYLLVPLLGIAAVLKRKWLALVFFFFFYTTSILQTLHLVNNPDNEKNWIFLYPSELFKLFSYFFAGACFYFFRDRIKINKFRILLAITSILFASWWVRGFDIVLPLAGTYLVFCFAYSPRIQFHDFAKNGDLSYGLYLYGWPIQQVIVYFFAKHIDANRLFFVAFPMALLAAWLSWHIVENPFLKMKRSIKKI